MYKKDLISCLKKNLETHRETFLKAYEGYRKRVIEELDTMVADARKGLDIRTKVDLPKPEDHSEDYEKSIQILELSIDDEIEVNERDIQRVIMDEWNWKDQWVAINTNST